MNPDDFVVNRRRGMDIEQQISGMSCEETRELLRRLIPAVLHAQSEQAYQIVKDWGFDDEFYCVVCGCDVQSDDDGNVFHVSDEMDRDHKAVCS